MSWAKTVRTLLCAAASVALAAALWFTIDAGSPSPHQKQILAMCDAVDEGRYDEAIESSASLVSADPDGRTAAECRCWALLNRDRRDDCAKLIDDLLLAAPEAQWVPHPVLSTLVSRVRTQQGRAVEAADLAHRVAAAYPADLKLLELEILTQTAIDGQQATLSAMEARLDDGHASFPMRIAIASSHLGNFDAGAALRVLGEQAPPSGHPLLLIWFETRASAIANQGDIAPLKRHFEVWAKTGADPADLRARYALRVSIAHLRDPESPTLTLLERALVDQASLRDGHLRWALFRRLIGTLISEGRIEDALSVYDEALQFVSFPNLTREEIVRAASPAQSMELASALDVGALVFRLGGTTSMDGTLLVSPSASSPSDQAYEAFAIAAGQTVEIERARSITPARWVFRDDRGRTRGSGTVWPLAGSQVEVTVEPGPPLEPMTHPVAVPTRAPDGQRRLFAIVLDCADWRLTQYLRARGELPLLNHLLDHGYRAVLESNPAFTAAAMEALVWPMRGRTVSFLGLVQRMGLELGGLASVGENPLGFLSSVLPESESLFARIGSGEHVAANMLFSHGGIDAGHHAQTVGPLGAQRKLSLRNSARTLTGEELRLFPGIDVGPRQRRRMETIAAEFDSATDILQRGEVDFLLLRVEPLDLLTHAFFKDLLKGGQDNGKSPLLAAYRYIDTRLAEVYESMDRDDVLLVMSDHGIRTPMQHETDALFVLAGAEIPSGRAPGQPHLRGVPRILAGLLGIETEWPETGIASWVEGFVPSRSAAL
jgi:hypothetical protein